MVYQISNCYIIATGWLNYEENFYNTTDHIPFKMPSDTPNNITGHTDMLLSGEMSVNEIYNKTHEIQSAGS